MKTSRIPTLLKQVAVVALAVPVFTAAYAFKIGVGGNPIHEGISRLALSNLNVILGGWGLETFSDIAIEKVANATAFVDLLHANESNYHFDSEQFLESSEKINELKQSIIKNLMRRGVVNRFSDVAIEDALMDLGSALHIIQDFFAHSNWVERHEANPSLPMPAFGMAKEYVFASIDAHQRATGNYSKSAQAGVQTCNHSGSVSPGTLTSGYYSFQMSDGMAARAAGWRYPGPRKEVDIQERKNRGYFTTLWIENAISDGWNAGEVGSPQFWPVGKCIHGGEPGTPGLNKDEPDRDRDVGAGLHQKARELAQQASEAYVNEVFRAIRLQVPDADAAICALIGKSGSAACKAASASTGEILGFEAQTEAYVGQKFSATVTGESLPPNLSVRLGTVDCRTVRLQTVSRLDVECTPYATSYSNASKDFDLSVRLGTGEIARTQKLKVFAAQIDSSPVNPSMFEKVMLWIADTSGAIKRVAWSFFETLGQIFLEKKDGTAVDKIFETSGGKSVEVEIFGQNDVKVDSIPFSLNVNEVRVDSVSPLTATIGTEVRFDVIGINLASGLNFQLDDCANIRQLDNYEGTSRHAFTCTFPVGTQPGMKQGSIGPVGSSVANSPFAEYSKALKSFSVDVSAPPAPAAPLVFFDNFDGASLDLSKWTIEPPNPNGGGIPATYSVAGSFLNVNVPGGSCGNCGVSDGSGFKPNVAPLTGDFEMVISAQELERISRDGTRPLSNIQLVLRDGNYQLGIYVNGDARNNTGAAGHVIYMYSLTPTGQDVVGTRELTVGQYNAYQLRIRRVGTLSYLAYKLDGDINWTEVAVRQSMPANLAYTPRIWIASGDGGGTRVNSSFKARLDFVSINGAGGSAASNADVLYEPFDGPALNNTKWSNSSGSSASYSFASGIINLGGRTSLDTKGKVVFSGAKIVVEYRAGGTEASVLLVDADTATPANAIMASNTMYRNWGLDIQAGGAFALTGGNVLAEGGYVVTNGRIDTAIKFYRLTLEGTKVTLERGVDANSITETLTGTMSTTTAGRRFYLQFGTGTPPYAPGAFDWISVKASNATVITGFYVPASANPGIDFVNPYASKPASCAVTATGIWNNGPTPDYGPNGAPGVCGAGCTFPNAPSLALILARGNGSYEVVGSSKTVALSAGERVAFWNNDGTTAYFDNRGGVQTTVSCQ